MSENPSVERQTYTVREAAKALGLGKNLTYDLVRRGEIRSLRVCSKIIIPRTEVSRLLNTATGARA